MERRASASASAASTCRARRSALDELLPADAVAKLREDVEMARGLCPPFDLEALPRRAT